MSTRTPVRPGGPGRPVVPPHKHERRRRVRPGKPRRRPRLPDLGRVARFVHLPKLSRTLALLVLAGIGVLAAALIWLVMYSPVLGVRTVDVTGSRGDSASVIRDLAAIPAGTPLARVDTGAVESRLGTLPQVRSVSVERAWPSTVRITVVERVAVAVVDVSGVQWLIDSGGTLFAQVTEAPAGVPLLEVERAAADDRATLAALEVIGALPADVHARLGRVSAASPYSVVLHMVGGRTVIWGSARDSERKAQVLDGVFGQPGGTIDVSSPSAVVIR